MAKQFRRQFRRHFLEEEEPPEGRFFYCRNPKKLREVAYLSSQITHAHPFGKEGTAIQACAVALAVVYGPTGSPNDFLAELRAFAAHDIYKNKLKKAGELLTTESRAEVIDLLGNGIEAFNSVPTAVYCFLRHPGSFEESVVEAVSLGGDTDTIASMAGAISGAWLGIEAIPEKWAEKLENRDYIEGLALRLWEVCHGIRSGVPA